MNKDTYEYMVESRDGWANDAYRMEKDRDKAVEIAYKLFKELGKVDFMTEDEERQKVINEATLYLLDFPDIVTGDKDV